MQRIEKGFFELVNPYNRKKTVVAATPSDVHSIVFWSKNYGPFLMGRYGDRLLEKGYRLFFNFTVNSSDPWLEPNLPPLTLRFNQLECLVRLSSAAAVNWRFDPVCFYTPPGGGRENNFGDFKAIAAKAADCGITRCITSFMDHYPKITRRLKGLDGFVFNDPPQPEKQALLLKMQTHLSSHGIDLYTCCEKSLMDNLEYPAVKQSACIDHDLLEQLFGGNLSHKKDVGQRRSAGCGCDASVDVGVYHKHPCPHSCLFCYANPVSIHKRHLLAQDGVFTFPQSST